MLKRYFIFYYYFHFNENQILKTVKLLLKQIFRKLHIINIYALILHHLHHYTDTIFDTSINLNVINYFKKE